MFHAVTGLFQGPVQQFLQAGPPESTQKWFKMRKSHYDLRGWHKKVNLWQVCCEKNVWLMYLQPTFHICIDNLELFLVFCFFSLLLDRYHEWCLLWSVNLTLSTTPLQNFGFQLIYRSTAVVWSSNNCSSLRRGLRVMRRSFFGKHWDRVASPQGETTAVTTHAELPSYTFHHET